VGVSEGEDPAVGGHQVPVAHLSVTPAEAGQPTGFDASASTVAFGSISTYAWNFGDGSTASTSTPTTSHTYATPGPYTATVTETDSAGTSTTQVFTGQTMSRNGGLSAVASENFTVAPSMTQCAFGLVAHTLSASYGPLTLSGLFCVNAQGVGNYTQGTVQGLGVIKVVKGVTSILAVGKNLALLGVMNGTHGGFIEFAPAPFKLGTFTLS
jgi:PKD repeat protein